VQCLRGVMQRRSFTRWFAAVSFLVFAGCVSPTLPLPPPDAPSALSVDTTLGEWTFRGSCLQGALVTIFNEETGEGAVVEDRDRDGVYEIRLKAQRCDLAWVQQTLGQDVSAPTPFVIAEKVDGMPVDPEACK
jgi:hypothetical protein